MLALTRVVMKPGDSRTSTVSFPMLRGHPLDRVERRRRAVERLNDLDELHLVDGIEEMHARHTRRGGGRTRPAR